MTITIPAAQPRSGTFGVPRLRQFFEPRSIALIGASDKSMWSHMVFGSLKTAGYDGDLYLINPNSPAVHGQVTVPSLAAIGRPVDLAFIMVNTGLVLPILHEMVQSGVRNAVILAGGFAEAGEAGQAIQREVEALAAEHDLALLGPNCLGYLNLGHKVGAMPGLDPRLKAGAVGIASQSGALGNLMLNHAVRQGIGLSAMISSGNEAVLAVNDSIEYLVHDDNTRVIAVFMESVRHPEAFIRVAKEARAAGKPIIAIKAGRSEASQRVAQAHTGALTGDDQVTDALFRQLGIIRVESIEELLITASVYLTTGVLNGNRLGFLAISGGLCDMGADIGEAAGLTLPDWTEPTKDRLRALLPELGEIHNPFDTTGAAVNRPELLAQMAAVLEGDPNIDVLVLPQSFPEVGSPSEAFSRNLLGLLKHHLSLQGTTVVVPDNTGVDISPASQKILEEIGLPTVPGGMTQVVRALGKIANWSATSGQTWEATQAVPVTVVGETLGAWSEHQARELLAAHGVPVIPSELALSAGEAVHAAQRVGFPVALKIVSRDILHKSDIGGVKLNLQDEADVRTAFDQVMQAAAAHAPGAMLEGALISPMRSGGVELLVGVVRDPSFGQVLAVGLGGIYVEVFKDASLRVLPINRADVRTMLDELQGRALLEGVRGTQPANLERVTDAVMSVMHLAQGLGERLESLEINPLVVDGDRVEALDAVLTWKANTEA